MASGEAAFAIPFTDFVDMAPINEHPVRVLAIKRHLQRLIGQPRFKQRLVHSEGQMLPDDMVLHGPMDAQLITRPFEESSQDQTLQLQQAARDNNILTIEQLLQRPQDPDSKLGATTPLYAASQGGHLEAVRLLLEANADQDKATNDEGEAPLYVASQEGHLEVVRLLLEANADKDRANNAYDQWVTPLHIASQDGHMEIVRLLLEANADKDTATTDEGEFPLYIASQEGHLEVVRLLLEANADKDKATNDEGEFPLYIASQEVVRLLLEANADKDKARNDGVTPLYVASQKGQLEVVRLQQEHDVGHNLARRQRDDMFDSQATAS